MVAVLWKDPQFLFCIDPTVECYNTKRIGNFNRIMKLAGWQGGDISYHDIFSSDKKFENR